MKQILIIIGLLVGLTVFGQRISGKENVKAAAQQELSSACASPNGDIYLKIKELGVSGKVLVEYSLQHNGKVLSIRIKEHDNLEVKQKNALQDYLYYRRFGFKTVKGANYKFEHEFQF